MKASRVTIPVRASEITEAKIGPTHGVQRSPKESPIKNPGIKPGLVCPCGTNFDSLPKRISICSWNLGIRKEIPKRKITTMEINLKESAGIPKTLTIVVRNNVKKVKLATNPIMTPIGRDFPVSCPPIVDVRIMGSIGKMQGERIVTIPAKKAKAIKIIICQFLKEVPQNPHRSKTELHLRFCLFQQKYAGR